jgi:hypothetical protein
MTPTRSRPTEDEREPQLELSNPTLGSAKMSGRELFWVLGFAALAGMSIWQHQLLHQKMDFIISRQQGIINAIANVCGPAALEYIPPTITPEKKKGLRGERYD